MQTTKERPNLFELRREKGCTQQQIAEKAGLSRAYYSLLETGSQIRSVATAKKLAKAFDVKWYDFFGEDEEMG